MPNDKPNTSNPFGSPAPAQDDGSDQIFIGLVRGEALDLEAAEAAEAAALPVPGEYRCRCIGAENKDSSAGNTMIILTYKIVGNASYPDTEFTSNVVIMYKTLKRVSRTFKAFGLNFQGKVSVNVGAFVNKEVMLTLAHREWNESTYIDVKSIRACSTPEPGSTDDTDIPF